MSEALTFSVPLWALWLLSWPAAFALFYLVRALWAVFWLWLVFRKP